MAPASCSALRVALFVWGPSLRVLLTNWRDPPFAAAPSALLPFSVFVIARLPDLLDCLIA